MTRTPFIQAFPNQEGTLTLHFAASDSELINNGNDGGLFVDVQQLTFSKNDLEHLVIALQSLKDSNGG